MQLVTCGCCTDNHTCIRTSAGPTALLNTDRSSCYARVVNQVQLVCAAQTHSVSNGFGSEAAAADAERESRCSGNSNRDCRRCAGFTATLPVPCGCQELIASEIEEEQAGIRLCTTAFASFVLCKSLVTAGPLLRRTGSEGSFSPSTQDPHYCRTLLKNCQGATCHEKTLV